MNKQRLFFLRAVPALTFPIPQNRTAIPDRLSTDNMPKQTMKPLRSM